MSLIQIKSVSPNLHTGTNWSLQLLNIKSSKRTGINYSSRQITLSPENHFYDILNDIIRIYTGNGKKSLDLIENVREYDGTADSLTIYKLSAEDTLISSAYATLMQQIAAPNVEDDPFQSCVSPFLVAAKGFSHFSSHHSRTILASRYGFLH